MRRCGRLTTGSNRAAFGGCGLTWLSGLRVGIVSSLFTREEPMNEDDKRYSRTIRIKTLIREQPGISGMELTLATKSIKKWDRDEFLDFLIADEKIRFK